MDGGATWTDVLADYDPATGNYTTGLDVSDLPSGGYQLVVRAMDALDNVGDVSVELYLDADDPQVMVGSPSEGEIFMSTREVFVVVDTKDNTELVSVRTRLEDHPWQDLDRMGMTNDMHTYALELSLYGEVGPLTLQVEVVDGVGRTTLVEVGIISDAMAPMLELRSPEPNSETLLGEVLDLEVEGTVWDDYGLESLVYLRDDWEYTDAVPVTRSIDDGGGFNFTLPVSTYSLSIKGLI